MPEDPNQTTDTVSDALKAKYAEIASLKKAIEEKQVRNSQFAPTSAYPSVSSGGMFPPRKGGAIRSTRYAVRGNTRGRGFGRGGYASFRGGARGGFVHRHVTAVFDTSGQNGSGSDSSTGDNDDGVSHSPPAVTGYVTKQSRGGMSLVSTDIYARDQERYEAIQREKEELQKKIARQKRRELMQKQISKLRTKTDSCDRVKIDGQIFAVCKRGSKLIPLATAPDDAPSTTEWHNRTFTRSSNGTLRTKSRIRKTSEQCRYFSRTGQCMKGSKCKYIHNRSRIRVCQQNLVGKCTNHNCLFCHDINEFNTPVCRYYIEGKCTNSACKFMHHKPPHYGELGYEVWVCRPFAVGGWCSRGQQCPFIHLFNCPDFEEDGNCPRGKSCYLAHPTTIRTQELIETPMTTYVREDGDDIVVDEKEKKILINSYTVDPDVLLHSREGKKYDFYIDQKAADEKNGDMASVSENQEFMIVFSDLDESSDFSSDEEDSSRNTESLSRNNDYVSL